MILPEACSFISLHLRWADRSDEQNLGLVRCERTHAHISSVHTHSGMLRDGHELAHFQQKVDLPLTKYLVIVVALWRDCA